MAAYAVRLERSAPLRLPRHPEAPKEADFTDWCYAEKAAGRPLAVDLFSGAGGLGTGIEAAGWTVVVAADHDRSALETHQANFRGLSLNVDMSDKIQLSNLIEALLPLEIDLIAGGPPCQPFSRAGRAKISSLIKEGSRDPIDPRKELWRSFIDVVLAISPRAVLMENVPDMAIGDDLGVVRQIAEMLEDAKYLVDYRLLDAWRYGVPQHRKRFILQARRDGIAPIWPEPLESFPTVRDAIGDLPRLGDTTGARTLPYAGEPQSALAKMLRGRKHQAVIYDHITRPVRDDDREAYKLMTSSTLYSDLPAELRRYRSDTFIDKYKRLDWDSLSRTITAHIAKDGYWYIHPSEHRTLTIREAARIQTFSDEFRFAGTRSDAFRQIGNAVPPLLGRYVSEAIRPVESQQDNSIKLSEKRILLLDWAKRERESQWWRYPGPEMTQAAALIGTFLNVTRLAFFKASSIMEALRGAECITEKLLDKIDVQALTPRRKERIQMIRNFLHEGADEREVVKLIESMLTETQRNIYDLLQGKDILIVNAHVVEIATILMDLPADQQGMRTGVKVAVSQIISRGEEASMRMSAILSISAEEAKKLIGSVSA